MNLMMIKDTAEQIAVAIHKIMGVDVVIVDSDYERVTDTFAYDRDRIVIRKESIVGRIIERGKPLAIDDKKVFRSCLDCPDFSTCRMQSLIGVPIIYNDVTVGAIALAISPKHMRDLFGNLGHTVDFLEKMADMLSGKLRASDDYEKLNLAKRQREILVDSMDDSIVLVDREGRIAYYNEMFDRLFLFGKSALDVPLIDILHHPQIELFFRDKAPLKNKLIYCETKKSSFDGFFSAAVLEIEGHYHGAVFTFRHINNAQFAYECETHAARKTLADMVAKSGAMQKAVSRATLAAKTDEAVLLEGKDPALLKDLARAIHDASPRSNANFLVVECAKTSPQELEQELFGDEEGSLSKIRLAHKGTLCLCGVENLPYYLQRRLCDYLVRGTVVISHSETTADARLILTTSDDLDRLAAQGFFEDTLFDRIRHTRLRMPDAGEEPADIEEYFQSFFQFFTERYGMEPLQFEPEVLERLYRCNWDKGLPHMRMVAEYIVRTARGGIVTSSGLPPLPGEQAQEKKIKPVRSLVEDQIRLLISDGKSRDEIAEILGISRATLYRKLKQLNIT